MTNFELAEPIEISDRYPRGYFEQVRQMAGKLERQLPFAGPFDTVIIGGSGLLGIADQIPFEPGTKKEIKESDIGLPTGTIVEGHSDTMIAGITTSGEKILVRSRMVHPYNVHTLGFETSYGRLSQAEVATMYLHVLSELGGSKDIILSCACGGIANPTFAGKAPLFRQIPEITIIASDLNMAYASALQGAYVDLGDAVRFPPSRESDMDIKDRLQKSWKNVYGKDAEVQEHVYLTSPSTSGYENREQVRFALQNLTRLVGMSFSTEAERLSTLRKTFPNMLGLGVATNPLLLMPRGGNDALLAVRQHLGISLSEFDKTLMQSGIPLIPSKQEIDFMSANELYVTFPATHEDVKRAGAIAVSKLGPVLVDMLRK